MTQPTEAFLLGPKNSIQETGVILSYGNPCEYMITDELQKEIAGIEAQTSEAKTHNVHPMEFCRSESLYQFESCLLKSRKLESTMRMFPSLVNGQRTKRDVYDDIIHGLIRLPKMMLAAATTWLKSISKTTIYESALTILHKLLKELLVDGHNEFKNLTLVTYNVLREEVSRVSLYAQNNPSVLEDTIISRVGQYPVEKFMDCISDEFVAAGILLVGIYNNIKHGHVDTKSLGELTGNHEVYDTDLGMTKLIDIVDMPDQHAIKFIYDVTRDIGFFDRIIVADLVIIIIVILVIIPNFDQKLHVSI